MNPSLKATFAAFLILQASTSFADIVRPPIPASTPKPTLQAQCDTLNKDFEALDKSVATDHLKKLIEMTQKIPRAQETDGDKLILQLNKDFTGTLEKTIITSPNCGNLRLQMIRKITRLAGDKATSKEQKQEARAAILNTLTAPHIPMLIESMINLGALKEVVDADLFPHAALLKEQIDKRTQEAKKNSAWMNENLYKDLKDTPLMDSSKRGSMRAYIADPANKKPVDEYKSNLLNEIKSATEIQKEVNQFAIKLQK